MTFFGTQPTLTQVPPKRWDSITAVLAPYAAARCAQAKPPLPPPRLMRSKPCSDTVNSVLKAVTKPMIYCQAQFPRMIGADLIIFVVVLALVAASAVYFVGIYNG